MTKMEKKMLYLTYLSNFHHVIPVTNRHTIL